MPLDTPWTGTKHRISQADTSSAASISEFPDSWNAKNYQTLVFVYSNWINILMTQNTVHRIIFAPVIFAFYTGIRFRPVSPPRHSCTKREIMWEIRIRSLLNSPADNKSENKTGPNISLYTVPRNMLKYTTWSNLHVRFAVSIMFSAITLVCKQGLLLMSQRPSLQNRKWNSD